MPQNCSSDIWVNKLITSFSIAQLHRKLWPLCTDPKWNVESETQMKRTVGWVEKKKSNTKELSLEVQENFSLDILFTECKCLTFFKGAKQTSLLFKGF